VSAPLLDVSERHSKHDRKREPNPPLHLVDAADKMALKAEAVVDSFQCRAPVVAPMPTRATLGRRHEDPAILFGNLDANDPPIGTGIDVACGMAGLGARAHPTDASRRTMVLQGVAVGFEALNLDSSVCSSAR